MVRRRGYVDARGDLLCYSYDGQRCAFGRRRTVFSPQAFAAVESCLVRAPERASSAQRERYGSAIALLCQPKKDKSQRGKPSTRARLWKELVSVLVNSAHGTIIAYARGASIAARA